MELPKKMPRPKLPSKSSADIPDDQKRVVVNRYRVEKKLGSGNFGTAYLVKDLKATNATDELKVLKQIPCGDLQPDETVDAMHEAKLLSKLDNTGIVKFHDSFVDGEFFCIVTEYCEGGDLDEYVVRMKKRGQTIPEKQVMDWTVELLMAVHYMHCRRVLHRDLKARNIFLRDNRIKIGDFGISRILMGTADMATTFTGTPYYMSPEVLKHEGYNSKSDVWSIGCIIFELCCHRHAFEGQGLMGVMFKIVEGDCPALPDKYSKSLHSLLQKIFTKDPSERPSASEILKFPFVARHAQKMKMASRPAQESLHADEDAQALEITLQKKYHYEDLQSQAEANKLKNMTPRERMRIRKQHEADKKARELAEAARANLHGNMTRKHHMQEQNKQSDPAPWSSSVRREKTFAPSGDETFIHSTFRPKTAPEPGNSLKSNEDHMSVVYEEEPSSEEDSEDGDNEATMVPATVVHRGRTLPANTTVVLKSSRLLGQSVNLDDRPITPMKDRMVYDVKHSSLDFKDGVPEDPSLAETYYSQFAEFEPDDKDSSRESNDADVEVIHGDGGENIDNRWGDSENEDDSSEDHEHLDEEGYPVLANEGTLIGAVGAVDGNGTLGPGGDEAALIKHMENHLSTLQAGEDGDGNEDYNEDTIMLADDTVAGAFGPTARSIKIKNLRKNGESKLGKDAFKKAYEFLKKMRYGDDGATSTVDENHIMTQLRHITSNISDCFIIDQLLFLEKQADIEKL